MVRFHSWSLYVVDAIVQTGTKNTDRVGSGTVVNAPTCLVRGIVFHSCGHARCETLLAVCRC